MRIYRRSFYRFPVGRRPMRQTTTWPPPARTAGPARSPRPTKRSSRRPTWPRPVTTSMSAAELTAKPSPWRRSGTASAPITFQPYQGEQVTVTGLDQLNSGWTNYSGSIYRSSAGGNASQVFVGGQMMTEARFPNAGYNNPLHAATITVDSATVNTPATATTVTSAGLGNPANGTWSGQRWQSNREPMVRIL